MFNGKNQTRTKPKEGLQRISTREFRVVSAVVLVLNKL
jgi:predicted house-cleaning NTP pyrophosphatase (Maf/HAM1 superfamily)